MSNIGAITCARTKWLLHQSVAAFVSAGRNTWALHFYLSKHFIRNVLACATYSVRNRGIQATGVFSWTRTKHIGEEENDRPAIVGGEAMKPHAVTLLACVMILCPASLQAQTRLRA